MLRGIFAPIPTPFKNGQIAYDALKENLARWAGTDLTGLVVLGSNGEFILLTEKEKVELVRFVRDNFPAERPIIAGTGCESTQATIELTEAAAEAGCAAALVVTPHYYKGDMTESTLERYYLDVADAASIPVMLYNMPRNTGLSMSPGLVCRLAKHPNIVGIKDSGGNITQIAQMVKGTPDDFAVFAGSGSFLLPSLVMGAVGGTLAVANVMPNESAAIQKEYEAGNLERAVELQRGLLEVNAAVTAGFGVPGLKAALDMIGYFGGEPRQPLLPLTDEKRAQLERILEDAGVFEAYGRA